MHIPDGYLSPQTYVPLYAVFVAAIGAAVRKIRKDFPVKNIPYLGMAAAFSFLIMMFNLPVPGGTTGHAVGSALIAILFGPWAAVISVSVALLIQALIFGDGGITTLGANCVNMAVFMPWIAYLVFRLMNGTSNNRRRIFFSGFAAGYISMVLTAILTAAEFGIQPLIASDPEGKALFCPYDLKIAIPAMAIEHLLLFGVVEGLVTALVIRYFARQQQGLVYALKQKKP